MVMSKTQFNPIFFTISYMEMKRNYVKAKTPLLVVCSSLFLLLQSCDDKCYRYRVHEVDFYGNGVETIHGERVPIEVAGLDDIYIADSLLIFTSMDPASHVKIFDTHNYASLAAICPSGRAKNEFVSTPVNHSKQMFESNGQILLPLVDYSRLKIVNITASINKQSTIIDINENCIPVTDGNFVLLDESGLNRFEYHRGVVNDGLDNEIEVSDYSLVNGDITKTLPVFNSIMKGEGSDRYRSMYCYGVLSKNPKSNLVIQTLDYMDYILFFDLDRSRHFAIHQKGTMTFEDDVTPEVHFRFSDCLALDSYFMALHCDDDLNRHIIVLDLQGNVIKTYLSDVAINRIAFDRNTGVLYGIDRVHETVYAFNLGPAIYK